LAEEVGIGANSVALITLIEFGKRPPRLDVARRLAEALGIDEALLAEWSQTRHKPLSPEEVDAARSELEARFRNQPANLKYGPRPSGPLTRRGPAQPGDIPVYEAGVDPDEKSAAVVEYLRREGKLREEPLVRPVAYRVAAADVLRLSKVKFPPGYAVVSRQPLTEWDPGEPYAIRFRGKVVLAYALWDGTQLLLHPEAGSTGVDSLAAVGVEGLRKVVIGRVAVGTPA
jgi:transcriptional regulator with XRE-family HTH domain